MATTAETFRAGKRHEGATVVDLDRKRPSALRHPRAIDALLAAYGRVKERRSLDGWRRRADIGRETGARC